MKSIMTNDLKVCAVCGSTYNVESPSLHTWNEWKETCDTVSLINRSVS